MGKRVLAQGASAYQPGLGCLRSGNPQPASRTRAWTRACTAVVRPPQPEFRSRGLAQRAMVDIQCVESPFYIYPSGCLRSQDVGLSWRRYRLRHPALTIGSPSTCSCLLQNAIGHPASHVGGQRDQASESLPHDEVAVGLTPVVGSSPPPRRRRCESADLSYTPGLAIVSLRDQLVARSSGAPEVRLSLADEWSSRGR